MLLSGNKVEKLCDLCNITLNKNAVFGDSSALAPGGVRIGKRVRLIEMFLNLPCWTLKIYLNNVFCRYSCHDIKGIGGEGL